MARQNAAFQPAGSPSQRLKEPTCRVDAASCSWNFHRRRMPLHPQHQAPPQVPPGGPYLHPRSLPETQRGGVERWSEDFRSILYPRVYVEVFQTPPHFVNFPSAHPPILSPLCSIPLQLRFCLPQQIAITVTLPPTPKLVFLLLCLHTIHTTCVFQIVVVWACIPGAAPRSVFDRAGSGLNPNLFHLGG